MVKKLYTNIYVSGGNKGAFCGFMVIYIYIDIYQMQVWVMQYETLVASTLLRQ